MCETAKRLPLRRVSERADPPLYPHHKNSDGQRHRSFHVSPPRTVAAALSAAVTSTNSQESAPTSQGHIVCKKNQLEPQPLFGRGPGEGKDSHSRQWRLSMAVFLNRNKRPQAAPIEVAELLLEKPPPPAFPHPARSRRLCQPP